MNRIMEAIESSLTQDMIEEGKPGYEEMEYVIGPLTEICKYTPRRVSKLCKQIERYKKSYPKDAEKLFKAVKELEGFMESDAADLARARRVLSKAHDLY